MLKNKTKIYKLDFCEIFSHGTYNVTISSQILHETWNSLIC